MKLEKKLVAIQLFAIFAAITLITLLFMWGYRINMESKQTMMSQTMGDMMAMHGQNMALQDLLKQKEMKISQNAASQPAHSSHHQENGGWMKSIHYITTITIIMLLPFIIAGSVFLFVEWLK